MDLSLQKKLACKILGVSPRRVYLDMERKDEIKEAITRADVRGLIKDGAIVKLQARSISGGRARKLRHQKSKGLRKGHGSRKGAKKARTGDSDWVTKIRVLREFLRELRDKELIAKETFQDLLGKAKGGFFRNRRHIKVFIEERQLALKK